MQTDHGRPIRSNFDRGQEKPSPVGLLILAAVSMATQTWPKFGHGLRHSGLTALSAGVVLLPHMGPPASGTEIKCPKSFLPPPEPCRPAAATSASCCCPPTHRMLWPANGGMCSHFPAARPPHLTGLGLVLGHLLPRPRGVRPFARPVFRRSPAT
jgi:hypothetical protein